MTLSDTAAGGWAGPARRLHPFTILFAAIDVGRRFLLPAIIGGVSAGDEVGEIVRWALGLLAIPALGVAIAKYVSFHYRLAPEELVIDSGVLNRKHRVIPLSRIQNIELRQGLLQTFCGVVELRAETAGGGGETEAVLSVLDRHDGELLREELLARRRRVVGEEPVSPTGPRLEEPSATLLAHLSPRDLAVAGATANEAGLIAAGLIGVLQFVDRLPSPIPQPLRDLLLPWREEGTLGVVLLVLGGVALLLIVGWIVSVVGSMVGYHDFTLELSGEELRKRYGLLSRRETSVPLERVQSVRVEESLLRRPLGLASLKVETAGGAPGQGQRGGAEAFLPFARKEDIDRLVAGVFPDLDYNAVRLTGVHARARRRLIVRYSLRLLVMGALLAVAAGRTGWLVLGALPVAFGLAHWQYRNRGYGTAPGYVVARRGVFNRTTWVIPERKLQTLHATQDPFQRRLGLGTLAIDTAAGGRVARIVDLAHAEALAFASALAARVPQAVREGDRRSRERLGPAAEAAPRSQRG